MDRTSDDDLKCKADADWPSTGTLSRLLDKKRSLPPGNDATGDGTRTASLLSINDRRERSYVRLRFCWKRSTCCQVLFIALWTCVVGGEEPRRSEAVMHFAEIRGARQDVIAGIKGIDA